MMRLPGLVIAGALEALDQLPDASCSLVVADPDWRVRDSIQAGRGRNRQKFTDRTLEGFDWHRPGDPVTIEEQQAFLSQWTTRVYRILRPGGHLICWYDAQRISHVYDHAFAGLGGCWVRRQVIVWAKAHPVPRAGQVNFMSGCELAAWLTKESASRKIATFNAGFGQSSNVQVAPATTGHKRVHPAQKPDAICEWLLTYLSNPGDTVMDLFAGSFAFSRVACEMERHVIAIERHPVAWNRVWPDHPIDYRATEPVGDQQEAPDGEPEDAE